MKGVEITIHFPGDRDTTGDTMTFKNKTKPSEGKPINGAVNCTLPALTASGTGFVTLMIGNSLCELHSLLLDMADAEMDILLVGERGTGKELAARFFAQESRKELAPINCSAMEDTLLSSELFGHKEGAFTGATKDHDGLIMAVYKDKGKILFLDEIGDASDRFQAKMLRYLETGDFLQVGSEKVITDKKVSVICATSKHDSLRLDLRDRFQPVMIPPLRERRNDITELIKYFWNDLVKTKIENLKQRKEHDLGALKEQNLDDKELENAKKAINQRYEMDLKWAKKESERTISSKTLSELTNYTWPGNVRELKRALTLAPILCKRRGGKVLRLNDFPNIPDSRGKKDKSEPVKFSDIKLKREPLPITTFLRIPDEQVLDDKVLEQVFPKDYEECFWRYLVEKGYTPKEIEKKYMGKISLANIYKKLQNIKKKDLSKL